MLMDTVLPFGDIPGRPMSWGSAAALPRTIVPDYPRCAISGDARVANRSPAMLTAGPRTADWLAESEPDCDPPCAPARNPRYTKRTAQHRPCKTVGRIRPVKIARILSTFGDSQPLPLINNVLDDIELDDIEAGLPNRLWKESGGSVSDRRGGRGLGA